MSSFKFIISHLVNRNWFIMSAFFPLVMIYKMGLFLHPVFTLIFILLGLLQILVSLSLLTNKKEKTQGNDVFNIKKKMLVLFTFCVFIGINLFACWVSYKTAQRESVRFDNLHLIVQIFYILSNLVFIISLFTALTLGKLPERDE